MNPQPRVDTLVVDPASGVQRRRSDYRGTAWFGRGAGLRLREDARFFLPDSLPYWRARLHDAVAACSVSLQAAAGHPNMVSDPHTEWVEDPRADGLAWLQLTFSVEGGDPLAISYAVVAVCDPQAVALGQVSD